MMRARGGEHRHIRRGQLKRAVRARSTKLHAPVFIVLREDKEASEIVRQARNKVNKCALDQLACV
jgi:hypothetical protein